MVVMSFALVTCFHVITVPDLSMFGLYTCLVPNLTVGNNILHCV